MKRTGKCFQPFSHCILKPGKNMYWLYISWIMLLRLIIDILKTASLGNSFASLIVLTGPLAYKKTTAFIMDNIGYSFLYSGVIGFLSVLFWFLYLQNRREKNLLFISISTSLWFIWPLLFIIAVYPLDLDFNRWWLITFIAIEWWPLAIASMVYTVGEIFNFKYKKALAIFGILFVIECVFSLYFNVVEHFHTH